MPTLDARIDDIVAGDDIQITRTITSIPSGELLDLAWFTVKEHSDDADADAIIQKDITTSNVVGTGHITDTGGDQTGAVRVDLTDTDTALLVPGRDYFWDLQVKTDGGFVYTPTMGKIRSVQGTTTTIT